MITYRYLSDGTKLSAEAVLQPEIDEGDGYIPAKIYRRRYKGSFTYVTDPDTGEEKLESIAWKEGMIFLRKMADPSESMDTLSVFGAGNHIIYDRWYVKDHLGNVRTVVELGSHVGEIVEQDDYLPFGTRFIPATQGVVCTADTGLYGSEHDNRYRYAGKEEQRFGPQIDLALLDFGARSYDPFTARWTSVDPLAYKYHGLSPYIYCSNDPLNRFDPNGMTDYFDKDGLFLWNDGLDNAKIKISTKDAIDNLQKSIADTNEEQRLNEIKKFCNASSYFHDSMNSMSDEAIISIYSHYNDTQSELFYDPNLIKNEETKDRAFNYNKSTRKIGVNLELLKQNSGFNSNSYDIYSAISVHEGAHRLDCESGFSFTKEELELRAIESQMNHPSWKKTSSGFKKSIDFYKSKHYR